jgi:RNA polymerase sigma-70 factor (ECF subfamily)
MNLDAAATIRDRIDELYRSDARRVFASLVRLLNDFDLAEDAMHEAYAAAAKIWQRDGMPANPRAWLISPVKFKAINALHRQCRLNALEPEIASRVDEVTDENAAPAAKEIEDDRLRLIFTCCHHAMEPKLQVPLTLREAAD